MGEAELRGVLEQLESAEVGVAETAVALAYLVRADVRIGEDELHGARRRALLLLAAGGDPRRELDPEGRAVLAVAAELDEPERRRRLEQALLGLRGPAVGLAGVSRALEALLEDGDLAWRRLAAALLAEELAGEG